MPFEDDLTAELRTLANRVDLEGARRVQEGIRGRKSRRGVSHVKRAGIAFVLGVAVTGLAATTLNITGVTGGEARSSQGVDAAESGAGIAPDPDFVPGPVSAKPGEPCPAARSSTLLGLASIGSPVWFPTSNLASAKNLSGAWLCAGVPTLDFGGISIAYEPGWNVEDPKKRWLDMAESWGDGRVEIVLGRPAFIQDVSESAPRGEVLVIVGTTLIRLLGDAKTPTADLIDIVASIDTKSPVTRSSAVQLSAETPAKD